METISNPGKHKAQEVLSKAIADSRFFTIVGRCTVDYRGRAESMLGEGERMLMVKEDRSVTVHKKDRHAPVNYQTAGCDILVSEEDEGISLTSRKPGESLTARFSDIKFIGVFPMEDKEDLSLVGTEKDLSNLLRAEPELIEEGLVPLELEKSVRTGGIDIYAKDRSGNLVVVELKRRIAGLDAVTQLKRYTQEIKRLKKEKVRGILCAPGLTPNAREMLASEGLEFITLDPSIEHLEKGRLKLIKSQKRIDQF